MKKLLGLLTALMITAQAYASIAVSPTRIEINANKLKANYITTAVEVRGDSRQPMRFRVYPGYFKITSNGEMNMEVPSDQFDISKKVKFVPSEFNVMPGKTQKVRINIANLNSLSDGESRAVLFLEDVNAKEFSLDTGIQGIGAQLIVKTRVGVPIYVDKGKVTKVGEIEDLKIVNGKNGKYTEMKIVSKGNSKIRYTGKVQIINGKKLIHEYRIMDGVVGDNNFYIARDKIPTEKINEKGEYTLRAVITYADENDKKKNVTKEIQINI